MNSLNLHISLTVYDYFPRIILFERERSKSGWVMSHMWMSHGKHMNETCQTCEPVMSHTWMSHVTQMNGSCQTYEWVMSCMWLSHITHAVEWALEKYCDIGFHMLHSTRIKHCVKACTVFSDIECLMLLPYVVPKKNVFKNYTTYDMIFRAVPKFLQGISSSWIRRPNGRAISIVEVSS
jgi:hypothetical protein